LRLKNQKPEGLVLARVDDRLKVLGTAAEQLLVLRLLNGLVENVRLPLKHSLVRCFELSRLLSLSHLNTLALSLSFSLAYHDALHFERLHMQVVALFVVLIFHLKTPGYCSFSRGLR